MDLAEREMDKNLMNPKLVSRLDYIDVDMRRLALDNYQSGLPETLERIRAEPEKLPQTRYSCLASEYETIALLQYALGYPLKEVRDAFAEAARALLKVFELRGQEEA